MASTVKLTIPSTFLPKSYVTPDLPWNTVHPEEELEARRAFALETDPLTNFVAAGDRVLEVGARIYSEYGIAAE